MPDRQPHHPGRRGSALRSISIGCVLTLLLLLGVLALTFGYFGPNLPHKDYELEHRRFVEQRGGLTPDELVRAEQLLREINASLEQHIQPLLFTEHYYLGGSEIDDPELPPEQRSAIEAAIALLEDKGINSRIDVFVALGFALPGDGPDLRNIARLQVGGMRLAWKQGDAVAATQAYRRIRGLADAQAASGLSMMSRVNAISLDMAAMSVRELLTERSADAALLDAMARTHEEAQAARAPDANPWPSIEQVFEGERILVRAELLEKGSNVPIRVRNAGAAAQEVGRIQERAVADWSLSGLQRLEAIRDDADNDTWSRDTGPLAFVAVAGYSQFLATQLMHEMSTRGTTLAFAIERFYLARGRLPNTLDELMPRWLESLPLDPINDQPFRYILDEDSPLGYKLYSVGFDGVDNGGTEIGPDGRRAYRLDAGASDYLILPLPTAQGDD